MATSETTLSTFSTQPRQLKRVRGDGYTYLRGSTYWIAFYSNGKLIRESAKTSDPDKAERWLRKCTVAAHKADAINLTYQTPKLRKRNISELVESLRAEFKRKNKASPQNLSNLRRVNADFGSYRANALTSATIDRYIEKRQAAGDANASINRTTQLLKQAYLFAELTPPKVGHLPEENARKGFFSPAEIERVIQHLPKHLHPFTRFAWLTGMRKGEIASLVWADVDDDVIKLRAENAKNGEARTIPIEGEVAEVLGECEKTREIRRGQVVTMSSLLFHTPTGKRVKEFRKSWASACCKAGLGQMVCPQCLIAVNDKRHCAKCRCDLKYLGRIFHDLRRSAVRNMTRAGVQRHIAMSISGHKTESVFERYNISDVTDQRAALRATQQYTRTLVENVAVMQSK